MPIREPRLSLSEIARRVGLPVSTTHRILATLRGAGLVEQDGERDQYRLGLELLELGSVVQATMELHREAMPVVEALARESGETVHLGVFDGTQVVSIEKMEFSHGLAMNITIGKGVRCVAAPVRNHTGRVIASLSISGPATRITPDLIPRLAESVKEATAKLSAQLGYRPEDPGHRTVDRSRSATPRPRREEPP